MSPRSSCWLVLGLSAGVMAVLAACTGGDTDAAGRSAPREFEATFEVESPMQVVAGDGQGWILTGDPREQLLSKIDHNGRSTEVARVTGQAINMAPFQDGVVVAYIACAGDDCEETATEVLIVDGDGSTIADQELAREPGSPERSDGVRVFGLYGDVVWIDSSPGLIEFNAKTGRIDTREPSDVPLRRRYERETGSLIGKSPTVVVECVQDLEAFSSAKCSISSPERNSNKACARSLRRPTLSVSEAAFRDMLVRRGTS